MERRCLSWKDEKQHSKWLWEMGQLWWGSNCGGRVEEGSQKWNRHREHRWILSEIFNQTRKYEGIYILQHNDQTVQESIYKEGQLNGESRYYDKGGSIMCIETYKDGRLQEILPQ